MAPSSPPEQEVIAGLRLIRTDGVGPVTYHGLVAKYGSPRNALAAFPEFSRRTGRSRPVKLVSQATVERELEAIEKIGARLVSIWGETYPSNLAETSDAPPFLSVLGDLAHFNRPSIGIVGARNASLNDRKFAEVLAKDLSEAGYAIWSGLARGIDTAAHRGAIVQSTVAVMAGGVDVIYPRENTNLHQEICEKGALVSKMPPGTQPQARHFPRRNRIISGASLGVVVVEGTPKSGSLITARLALDQGREVFAVPGSPLDPRAQGPNNLIRDGATLIRNADDVLQELDRTNHFLREGGEHQSLFTQAIENNEENEPDKIRKIIIEEIGTSPVTVDELRRQCQVSAPILAAALLDLELDGRIERLPGNRICGLGDV